MAAPCTLATNSPTVVAGQADPKLWMVTHGLLKVLMGRKSTPDPCPLRVNSSPEPLQSGLSRFKCGQKFKVSAPAKVSFGACASTAYASVPPDENPANRGAR